MDDKQQKRPHSLCQSCEARLLPAVCDLGRVTALSRS